MSRSDPAEQALIRLELRRFTSRCDMQEASIQRADTLREVARLTNLALPYKLSDETQARDMQRHVAQAAEERARQLIAQQIEAFSRGEEAFRSSLRSKLREDWSNLTGSLAHLRTWAQGKLTAVEQNQ